MAATKKPGLPEHTVSTGDIVDYAKKAIDARTQVARYTTDEKDAKENIETEAIQIREQEEAKNYIGKINITSKDFPPIRVEFKTDKGKAALDLSQEPELDRMFGASRPLLWGRETIVTAITNPDALIAKLKSEGKNPGDYLTFGVKKGMDGIIAQYKDSVISQEALVPQEGYLNVLNETRKGHSEETQAFTSVYLNNVLKPTVVLGTKGKE
jgi:hypothetical protein